MQIKNFKDFKQFVSDVSKTSEMRFTEMSREEYQRHVDSGEFKEDAEHGWPKISHDLHKQTVKITEKINDSHKTISRMGQLVKNTAPGMDFQSNQNMDLYGQRPHPKSKRVTLPVDTQPFHQKESKSFWQKLMNIFKFKKDAQQRNEFSGSYDKK